MSLNKNAHCNLNFVSITSNNSLLTSFTLCVDHSVICEMILLSAFIVYQCCTLKNGTVTPHWLFSLSLLIEYTLVAVSYYINPLVLFFFCAFYVEQSYLFISMVLSFSPLYIVLQLIFCFIFLPTTKQIPLPRIIFLIPLPLLPAIYQFSVTLHV